MTTCCHSLLLVVIGCLRCLLLYHSLSLVVPLVVTRCTTRCHSLSFVVTRCTTRCHSLSLVVIRCHSLSFVVTRCTACCTTRCHSLSFVVTRCTTRCHSLPLVVPLVVTRCITRLSFYKRCFFNYFVARKL